jgi:hypothetical protein
MGESDVLTVTNGNGDRTKAEERGQFLDRLLPAVIAGLLLLVVVGTILTLVIVSNTDSTTSRLDTSSQVSSCRSQFANDRERIRANLEAASARLSAGLAEGLALVVEDPVDQEAIDAVRAELPGLVADVEDRSDALIAAIDEYDKVLDLPESQFVDACEARFGK